jgi:AmmeMemoRadiSam system protein B
MFYPEEKAETLALIRSFGLERGKGGMAQAIIAPHGAWNISGALAAAAFGAAAGRTGEQSPSRVVVLGPIHDRREQGLCLSNSNFFQTPLGNIPVDAETTEALESCSSLFEINDIPHLQEHSIEVLLPFVKYCFPKAAIVPVLMGRPEASAITALANALKAIFGSSMDDTLLVVSCNLAMDSSGERAFRMAEECMRLVTEKRGGEFSAALLTGHLAACGGGIVASLLQSGLVSSLSPSPSPPSLQSAIGEGNKTVCYGALSFS